MSLPKYENLAFFKHVRLTFAEARSGYYDLQYNLQKFALEEQKMRQNLRENNTNVGSAYSELRMLKTWGDNSIYGVDQDEAQEQISAHLKLDYQDLKNQVEMAVLSFNMAQRSAKASANSMEVDSDCDDPCQFGATRTSLQQAIHSLERMMHTVCLYYSLYIFVERGSNIDEEDMKSELYGLATNMRMPGSASMSGCWRPTPKSLSLVNQSMADRCNDMKALLETRQRLQTMLNAIESELDISNVYQPIKCLPDMPKTQPDMPKTQKHIECDMQDL